MSRESIYRLVDQLAADVDRLRTESFKPQNDRDNPTIRASVRAIRAASKAIWDDHRNKSLAVPGVKEVGL